MRLEQSDKHAQVKIGFSPAGHSVDLMKFILESVRKDLRTSERFLNVMAFTARPLECLKRNKQTKQKERKRCGTNVLEPVLRKDMGCRKNQDGVSTVGGH